MRRFEQPGGIVRTRLISIAAFATAFTAIPTTAGTAPVPLPVRAAFVEPDDVLSLATRTTDTVTPAVEQPSRPLPPVRMSLDCTKLSRVTQKDGTVQEVRSSFHYADVVDRQGVSFQTGISLWDRAEGDFEKLECTYEVGRGGPVISLERAERLPSIGEFGMGNGDVTTWLDEETGRPIGIGGVRMQRLFVPAYGRVRHSFTMLLYGGKGRSGERCFFAFGRIGRSTREPRRHGAHPTWPPPRPPEQEKAARDGSGSPARQHQCVVKSREAVPAIRSLLCPS